jgi:ATP-dependent RNA helicase DDX35
MQVPEMQRSELAGAVLQLKALGVDNLMAFDWLARPPAEALVRALEALHALRALGDDARSAVSPLENPRNPGRAQRPSPWSACAER